MPWDTTPSWPELLTGTGAGGVRSAAPGQRAPRHGRHRAGEVLTVELEPQISWVQAVSWSVLVALGVVLVLRTG